MNTMLRYGTPGEAGMDPQRIEHIKDLTRGWVEQGVTPSLVVLAARRGIIVLHEAYGVMGPERDAGPLQKDTIFPLASLSKPITTTAVMCLVEDGLLGLNRPVQWYIPEFVGEGKESVCVHHLLTQTSGLEDGAVWATAASQLGRVFNWPPDEQWRLDKDEFIHAACDAPLTYATGSEMRYGTANYELVGEIIGRLAGMSFPDFCRERILTPLGMHDTLWLVEPSGIHRLVRRARDGKWGCVDRTEVRMAFEASAALLSTAMDLAALGQMFLNGGGYGPARVLSRASIAAMTRNQIPGLAARWQSMYLPEASWGYGFNVDSNKRVAAKEALESPHAYSHDGASGTLLWMDPIYEILAVYLSVVSEGGLPPHMAHRQDAAWHLMQRRDLFIDALLGSIVD